MSEKEISVKFKTITPLWTGDAWMECKEIRPSSLMGSLRFWFEVISYFAGITNNENYKDGKLDDNLDEEEFRREVERNGFTFQGIDKALSKCGISLPSRIFGCTGWKSLVRIKKIKPVEDYCFGNKEGLPYVITISKENNEINEYNSKEELNTFINKRFGKENNFKKRIKKFREEYSPWYLKQPYFWGKFEVTFEIEGNIIESIFYPLLLFMEKYGFWGGGWNIGYGRLKIENVKEKNKESWQIISDWQKNEFKFSQFRNKYQDKEITGFTSEVNNFCDLENKSEKLLKYKLEEQIVADNFINIIKELIRLKAKHRRDISDKNERHNVFGVAGRNAQGTKIIPWIYKENGQLKGGFISIVGILDVGGNK